jgi:gamma-glutamylcysteine synthetase
MTDGSEVDRYVKDPSLLLELCQEVIDRLDAGTETDDTAAMEAQLREIAKAIDKLDKIGVAVPDALRAEKTRLAAALGVNAEAVQVLNHLTDELEELLKGLKARLGRTSEGDTTKKPRAKRSRSPKTPNATLRELIVEALRHHGGSCHKNDVLQYMEEKLQGKLLPGDMEWRETTRDHAWQNNACWERYQMTKDGVLKTGSPRGIWELSEDHA